MFHLVSYKWIRQTQVIPEYVVFYKNVGILLGGCLTVKNRWGSIMVEDGWAFPGVEKCIIQQSIIVSSDS